MQTGTAILLGTGGIAGILLVRTIGRIRRHVAALAIGQPLVSGRTGALILPTLLAARRAGSGAVWRIAASAPRLPLLMLSPLEAGTVAGRTPLAALSLAGGLPELTLPLCRLSLFGLAPTIRLIAAGDMGHRAVAAILAGPGTPERTHDSVG